MTALIPIKAIVPLDTNVCVCVCVCVWGWLRINVGLGPSGYESLSRVCKPVWSTLM